MPEATGPMHQQQVHIAEAQVVQGVDHVVAHFPGDVIHLVGVPGAAVRDIDVRRRSGVRALVFPLFIGLFLLWGGIWFALRQIGLPLPGIEQMWPALPLLGGALFYLGFASIAGTFLGGYLGDKFARRDVRWYVWLPGIATMVTLPFSAFVYLWADSTVACR